MDPADDASRQAAPVPASVRTAVRLVWTVVALAGITTLLTVVLRDQLVEDRSEGEAADLTPLAFVPVAVTLFFVVAAFAWVLVVFFRHGHGWARWVLTALVVFACFASVQGLGRGLPMALAAVTTVTMVVCLVLLVFLFHKDTGAFLRRSGAGSS